VTKPTPRNWLLKVYSPLFYDELFPAQHAWIRDMRPAIPCKARRSTDGQPCRNYAMHGQRVCHAHGGRAPQARLAALCRLDETATEVLSARLCLSLGIWLPPEDIQRHIAQAYRKLGITS
jgi:hypothetical protein